MHTCFDTPVYRIADFVCLQIRMEEVTSMIVKAITNLCTVLRASGKNAYTSVSEFLCMYVCVQRKSYAVCGTFG